MRFNVSRMSVAAGLVALLLVSPLQAAIIGPYTPDSNTVVLLHLDEDAPAVATPNAGTLGKNAYAVNLASVSSSSPATIQPGILGAFTYSGFGKAANLMGAASHALGYDNNNNNEFNPDSGTNNHGADALSHAVLLGADKSFTLEALVYFPSISFNSGENRQIIATDRSNPGDGRGFGWRFSTDAGGTRLQLNFAGGDNRIFSYLPTSGDNALAAETWFHAAVTYDGLTNTLTQYWTKLDPSVTVAEQLGTSVNPVGFDPTTATLVPLVFGNENRGVGGEGLRAYLDEVRISNIARSAHEFIFIPEPSTMLLASLGSIGLAMLAHRGRKQ